MSRIFENSTAPLIGGPADGRRVTGIDPTNPRAHINVVVEHGGGCGTGKLNMVPEVTIVEYRGEALFENDKSYIVYVHSSVPSVMDALLKGYRCERTPA